MNPFESNHYPFDTGYTIMACVESCAYIISKCKRRVDGQIDLNEVFGFLVEILSKCDGQVNFFTCTVHHDYNNNNK